MAVPTALWAAWKAQRASPDAPPRITTVHELVQALSVQPPVTSDGFSFTPGSPAVPPRGLADGPLTIEMCPHGCSEPSGCDICTAPPKYPEHEKLKAVAEKSQACGAFLEWLLETYTLAEYHKHGPSCIEEGRTACGAHQNELLPETVNARRLLATFFEIDEAKLEAEKVQMLAEMRQASTVKP